MSIRGLDKDYNLSRKGELKFLNPYNFVSTTAPVTTEDKSSAEKEPERHTGYITCKIVTKTPLAIPDTERKGVRSNADYYPFMTINGKKTIPGSSIRGVIRNIYETATNSCMVTVAGDDILTARTSSTNAFHAGLLKWEGIPRDDDNASGWVLYEAERIGLIIKGGRDGNRSYREFANHKYTQFEGRLVSDNGVSAIEIKRNKSDKGTTYVWGQQVWFTSGDGYKKNGNDVWNATVQDISNVLKEGWDTGYLYVGEAFPSRKHAESVFKERKKVRSITKDELAKLEATWEIYNNKSINRNAEHKAFYKGYTEVKEKKVIPIWYQLYPTDKEYKALKKAAGVNDKTQLSSELQDELKETLYLSFAAIGRKAYHNSLSDIKNVGHPCMNRTKLCDACALFGMVGNKAGTSMGSLVRFTDAECITKGDCQDNVLLKELGSPKPSYLPFYARNNGRNDYKGNGEQVAQAVQKLRDSQGYDAKNVEVLGRKFYWHNPKAATDPQEYTGDNAARSARFELVNPGNIFEFKVYYDGITEEQLEKLIWALTLGENNEDGNHCIKIGHGKPIGLGSAKVTITSVVEREIADGYRIVKAGQEDIGVKYIGPGQNLIRTGRTLDELLKITQWDAVPVDVKIQYPYVLPPRVDGDKGDAYVNSDNDAASHQWFTQNRGTKQNSVPGVLPPVLQATNQPLYPYQLSYPMITADQVQQLVKEGKDKAKRTQGQAKGQAPAGQNNGQHRDNGAQKKKVDIVAARVLRVNDTIINIKEVDSGKVGIVFSKGISEALPNKGDMVKVAFNYAGKRDPVYSYYGRVEK